MNDTYETRLPFKHSSQSDSFDLVNSLQILICESSTTNAEREIISEIYNQISSSGKSLEDLIIEQIRKIQEVLRKSFEQSTSNQITKFTGAGRDHRQMLDKRAICINSLSTLHTALAACPSLPKHYSLQKRDIAAFLRAIKVSLKAESSVQPSCGTSGNEGIKHPTGSSTEANHLDNNDKEQLISEELEDEE